MRGYCAVLLLGVLFTGCATNPNNRRPVTVGSMTCIEPPPDVITTAREAEVGAAVRGIQDVLKARVSTEQKVERIRQELPQLQSIEVLEYRMCVARGNGQISSEQYAEFLGELLPLLRQPQQESDVDELNDHSLRVESAIRRALHFPDAVSITTAPRTMLETLARDQAPRKLFETLKQHDDVDVDSIPEAGPMLRDFFRRYYEFEQRAVEFENDLLNLIGSTVAVRFPQAWRIYLRYVVLRFAGLSQEEVVAGGNFLNYGITWDDAERVFSELSSDPVTFQRFDSVLTVHQAFIEEVSGFKKLGPFA